MTDPLDGRTFTVTTTHHRGTVVSSPGVPTVAVQRCWQEWTVQVNTDPSWPAFYVPSVRDAENYLARFSRPGTYTELPHPVRVRWLLPGDNPPRGFADLADAMHFAAVMDRRRIPQE
jgi:hypothetical protein